MNKAMVMDLYELTMANAYFLDKEIDKTQKVVFDVFYRKNPDGGGFAIFAGLEQIVNYIKNLHFTSSDIEYLKGLNLFADEFLDYLRDFKFKGDIYAFPEGTIIYPNEPIITVVAPIIDAQIIETEILLQINHQSLIATKANRIVRAAQGRIVSDFGARRAHNNDSAIYGSRAAYIGGVHATATVVAGQKFNIPVSGTMAHSFIMYYKDEFEAFKHYALTYPDNALFLVDTYDVLKSGVPNTIRVQKEILEPIGKRIKGIRLDSGDLAYLSKQARKMLDDAGMTDCKIVASNSLDEFTIKSLIEQGAKIDMFGVGERMITAKSEPVFGAVYKIVAVEENGFNPRIKVSENIEKITNPGLKKVYRVYKNGHSTADVLAIKEQNLKGDKIRFIDQEKPYKNLYFENCTFKPLQMPIFKNGKLIYDLPHISKIREYVDRQLKNEIWEEEQRFENPQKHYINMTPELYEIKMDLLNESGRE